MAARTHWNINKKWVIRLFQLSDYKLADFSQLRFAAATCSHIPQGIYNSVSWPCTWNHPLRRWIVWSHYNQNRRLKLAWFRNNPTQVFDFGVCCGTLSGNNTVITVQSCTDTGVQCCLPRPADNGTVRWLNSENWAVVFLRTGFSELVMPRVSRKLLQGDFFFLLPISPSIRKSEAAWFSCRTFSRAG